MSVDQQILIRELPRSESDIYLDMFQAIEFEGSLSYMNWAYSEDANHYIWLLDISSDREIPIGFIGYNVLTLQNQEEFIYIMKFFVLKDYRTYDNPAEIKLVGDKKVSSVLFERISSKGKSIITLTSANEALDAYYHKTYGFVYDKSISEKFASIVGIDSDGFLYLDLNSPQKDLKSQHELKRLFG